MGDVALTEPVLAGMRKQHPDTRIVLLTRPAFMPFFTSLEGLQFFFPDFNGRHKGLMGLFRLFRDLTRQYKIDHVIDLHDILRSKIIRYFFKITGTPVSVIDKGRDEKRHLTRGGKKVQLKHTVERYCDVFARAGFHVNPYDTDNFIPVQEASVKAESLIATGMMNIGVAPFAKHILKMWPEQNMIRLLHLISEKAKCKIFLFGGREDAERMRTLSAKVPDSFNVIGQMGLAEELALLGKMDFMIAMDSSNMHMAALAGTKVISIWGGTDPLAGFSAWGQPHNRAVRIPVEDLTCRPCTVYGKGECLRGDFACMMWLTPEIVFKRIQDLNLL